MRKLCFVLFGCLVLTSCYRMPGDEEFSTVPTINNPTLTREKQAPMPGIGY